MQPLLLASPAGVDGASVGAGVWWGVADAALMAAMSIEPFFPPRRDSAQEWRLAYRG